MPDRTSTARHTDDLEHPTWCKDYQCWAGKDEVWGEHEAHSLPVHTVYGQTLRVGLSAEAGTPQLPTVKLHLAAHEDDVPAGRSQWSAPHSRPMLFEPEEARMLARLLLGAAKAWDEAQR